MRKVTKQSRPKHKVIYKVTHPLYGEVVASESWLFLCEYTMDVAIRHIDTTHPELSEPAREEAISRLADEMIATVTEHIEDNDNSKAQDKNP